MDLRMVTAGFLLFLTSIPHFIVGIFKYMADASNYVLFLGVILYLMGITAMIYGMFHDKRK